MCLFVNVFIIVTLLQRKEEERMYGEITRKQKERDMKLRAQMERDRKATEKRIKIENMTKTIRRERKDTNLMTDAMRESQRLEQLRKKRMTEYERLQFESVLAKSEVEADVNRNPWSSSNPSHDAMKREQEVS